MRLHLDAEDRRSLENALAYYQENVAEDPEMKVVYDAVRFGEPEFVDLTHAQAEALFHALRTFISTFDPGRRGETVSKLMGSLSKVDAARRQPVGPPG